MGADGMTSEAETPADTQLEAGATGDEEAIGTAPLSQYYVETEGTGDGGENEAIEETPADGSLSLTEQGSAVVIEYLPKIYTMQWLVFSALLLVMAYNFIKRNFFSHWD